MTESTRYLIRSHELKDSNALRVRHPLNANAEVYIHFLERMTGLQRIALRVARLPAGRESFVYHSHSLHEEFVYILSGRGTAEIGEERFDVGPGDFMGFPTDGTGHQLINDSDEDLVYLMGGERGAVDVASFPRLGKRLIFEGEKITLFDIKDGRALSLADWIAED